MSYRMHNRDSAICHGVELVQATGLESGRHEQDVTACGDAVGHAHAEAHPTPALILPMLLHLSAGRAQGAYVGCGNIEVSSDCPGWHLSCLAVLLDSFKTARRPVLECHSDVKRVCTPYSL